MHSNLILRQIMISCIVHRHAERKHIDLLDLFVAEVLARIPLERYVVFVSDAIERRLSELDVSVIVQ